jgi:hypothetical protein
MLAGTLYSFYAQRQAAEVAEKQARYNAKYNEQVQKQAARQEMKERMAQERQDRVSARRERARIEARYAKLGLAMTGSPLYALEEQAKVDELEIANQTRNVQSGFIRAMDAATTGRKMAVAEARMGAQAAKTAATAGLVSSLGSAAMSSAMFFSKANQGAAAGTQASPGATRVNPTMQAKYGGVYG